MSKQQYLISKYHWKSRKNFIELSVDSAFLFLGIRSETKTRNWRKSFYNMFVANYTFLTPTRCPRKLLWYTCLLHSLFRICFCFEKKSHCSYFSFQKDFHFKKVKIKPKKWEKDFLLDISIDSKCLNIGI